MDNMWMEVGMMWMWTDMWMRMSMSKPKSSKASKSRLS